MLASYLEGNIKSQGNLQVQGDLVSEHMKDTDRRRAMVSMHTHTHTHSFRLGVRASCGFNGFVLKHVLLI